MNIPSFHNIHSKVIRNRGMLNEEIYKNGTNLTVENNKPEDAPKNLDNSDPKDCDSLHGAE